MTIDPSSSFPEGQELPSLASIQEAHARIKQYIHRTPLHTSQTLNDRATVALGGLTTADGRKVRIEVALKCENLQRIGAFKIRGGLNATLRYLASSTSTAPLTLFTHSSGNHAQAIALTAKLLSTPERPISATIIMPSNASKAKKAGVIGYGATIVECSPDTRARQVTTDLEMEKVRSAGGLVHFISPFDHIDVLQGQGTTIVEVFSQIADVWGSDSEPDVVMTPAGGGGLLSGASVASKGYWKNVKVVGTEPAAANDLHRSFYSTGKTWHPAVNPPSTICDGLLTATGSLTFPTILQNVDEVMLANDEATIKAMKLVWERMKLIIEPSSALSLAVLLSPPSSTSHPWKDLVESIVASRPGSSSGDEDEVVRCLVVISGGNVELEKVLGWFQGVEA